MPKTPARKKPVRRKPVARKGVKAAAWTPDEIALLQKEVAKGPTAAAAFARVAKSTRRKVSAVSMKYYTMQKKSKRRSVANRPSVNAQRISKRPAGASNTTARVSATGSFDLEFGKLLGMLEASKVDQSIRDQARKAWEARQ